MTSRCINFGAGPSQLPESILQEAQAGLFNFNNTGIGIAEISHRSKEFMAFCQETQDLIRELLQVPPTHHILLTQGGATGQFSAVVLNMLARYRLLHPEVPNDRIKLDYIITGSWSKKAAEEARRLVGTNAGIVNIAADSRELPKSSTGVESTTAIKPAAATFQAIPPPDKYQFSPDPALIYYCDNETVDGVQFSDDLTSPTSFPITQIPSSTDDNNATNPVLLPLVGDYSSSFMSRPIPRLADHAIIYAGAQKNLGPAGLTILIVREDCLVDVDAAQSMGSLPVPISMSYKTLAANKSLYNTPPVLAIYITGLVLRRMKELGGLPYFGRLTETKSSKIYNVLRKGEKAGMFKIKVQEGSRSTMNVVFDILGGRGNHGEVQDGAAALDKFLAGANELQLKGLKGHRSVGGVRISLYNAITEEQVDQLILYIEGFLSASL